MTNTIAEKMNELGLLKDFVSMVSGGLAGTSSLMKADAIYAISYLFDKFGNKLEHSFMKEMKNIIILLLKENNKEIFKSTLIFIKKFLKNFNKHAEH